LLLVRNREVGGETEVVQALVLSYVKVEESAYEQYAKRDRKKPSDCLPSFLHCYEAKSHEFVRVKIRSV
jgi:hypothetical protein